MNNFGKIVDRSDLGEFNLSLQQSILDNKILVIKNAKDEHHNLIKSFLKDNKTLLSEDNYSCDNICNMQNSKPGDYAYYARWQLDFCWEKEAADICSLRVLELGHETTKMTWVDLEKIKNLINEEMFNFITKQTIVGWNLSNPKDLASRQRSQDYNHPALRIHPETGRESVYYSGPSTIGKDNDVWQQYLKYLLEFFQDTNNQFSVDLEKGDIIVWDNRCTSYTYSGSTGAKMQKMIIVGSKPFWY